MNDCITGEVARAVRSALGTPKLAEAYALPFEMPAVRHDTPSRRTMVSKSPRPSTTEIDTFTPICCALACAACSIFCASRVLRYMSGSFVGCFDYLRQE